LKKATLSREHVLATVVTLLEKTLIRIGNEEYARANNSFGLTTLRNEHVRVDGPSVKFH
jgi:DNA topoisomerase-1